MAKKIAKAPDAAVNPPKRFGNEAATIEYVPQEASFASRTPPPDLLSRGEFRLMVHPEQWVVSGDRLIPYFRKLAARDGTNGVQTRGAALDFVFDTSAGLSYDVPSLDYLGAAAGSPVFTG
jgi:hypothetical protein